MHNPNSYDTVTAPLYSYDAAKVLDENNLEFNATHIVEVSGGIESDPVTGLYKFPEDIVESAVKYLQIAIEDRRESARERPKRKASEITPSTSIETLSPEAVVTEDDIVTGGLRDVQVRAHIHASDYFPATIISWSAPVVDEDDDDAVPVRSFVIRYISDDKRHYAVGINQMRKVPQGRSKRKNVRLNDIS